MINNAIDLLVEKIKKGEDVIVNREILIKVLTVAVDKREVSQEIACKIDEELELNVFC